MLWLTLLPALRVMALWGVPAPYGGNGYFVITEGGFIVGNAGNLSIVMVNHALPSYLHSRPNQRTPSHYPQMRMCCYHAVGQRGLCCSGAALITARFTVLMGFILAWPCCKIDSYQKHLRVMAWKGCTPKLKKATLKLSIKQQGYHLRWEEC